MSDLPLNKLVPVIMDKLDEHAIKAEKRVKHARTELILETPFFGGLALRLKLAPTYSVPTMGTDGYRLYYNPLFVNSISFQELVGVCCHEVFHVMFIHPLRLYEREIMKWNLACDFAINLLIKDMGFALPAGGCLDEKWRGMTADEIYAKLPNPPKQKQGGGEGEGEGSGKPSPIGGQDTDNSLNGQRGCGGLVMPHGEDGRPLDRAQREYVETETKQKISAAAQMAKHAGNLPGELEQLIEGILETKVNWRDQLLRFVENMAASDYSWEAPERRYICHGKYICSLYSETVPSLAIIVDTSGSTCDPAILKEFASTLHSISTSIDIQETYVIYVDTRVVGEPDKLERCDYPIEFNFKGGGGTDFVPGFKWLEEEGISPSCCIYLTDLYCSSFPETPDYPVLWACWRSGGSGEDFEVPFGEIIDINPDD